MSPRSLAPVRRRTTACWWRLVALAAITLTLSGCISSKYKVNKPKDRDTLPVLGLTAESGRPVEARVETLIVYRSPGSWKKNAYWDEYVISVVNHSDHPLTIEAAELTGRSGIAVVAGNDPWELEKTSRSLLARNFDLGKDVVVHLGAGVMVFATTAVLTGTAAAATGTVGWTVLETAGTAGLIALPIFVGGSIYRNVHGKNEVEREFALRRLALPAEIAAGAKGTGSLFFPITPGPVRLILHYRLDGQAASATIDLAPLKDLHLKAPEPPPSNSSEHH